MLQRQAYGGPLAGKERRPEKPGGPDEGRPVGHGHIAVSDRVPQFGILSHHDEDGRTGDAESGGVGPQG